MGQTITTDDSTETRGAFFMTLRPRRSVDPKVAYILLGALFTIWFSAGMLMTFLGAWPIFGFFGAEFIFIAYMLRVIYRRTEMVEIVEITPQAVNVTQRHMGAEERQTFPAYWAQVYFEGSPTENTALEVRSHGKGVEIGAFLSAAEKTRIAGELAAVLRRMKTAAATGGT